jgi:pyruvate/2-oxoglutarate dehydrogenase complex dihydrolipoamide acyltransferase (E2) component
MVPEVNSNYDDKTNTYTQLPGVDISVAVATDKGLITPIVKDADKLTVKEISDRVKVYFKIFTQKEPSKRDCIL